MRALVALAVLISTSSLGCGDKSDATLSVSAENLQLTETMDSFGPKLGGSVDIVFDLGHYAVGPVTAEQIDLRLVRNGTEILTRAQLAPNVSTPLPVTVQPSSKTIVSYTISMEQLSATEATELCAGPVGVSGSVSTNVQPPITIATTPLTVTGCM